MKDRLSPARKTPGWEMALAWCPPADSPLLGGTQALGSRVSSEGRRGTDQAEVTRRYDRMAWLYDAYDAPMELMGTRTRRKRLVSEATGDVLEVGVGTGKNLAHYPVHVTVTGIDISERMLARARRRIVRLKREARLHVADVTKLPFSDGAFDTVVATCVFCSVADPVAGLQELGRVTKPDGRILLLEHVRPQSRLMGWLADRASLITRRVFGFNANRRTEENILTSGLEILELRRERIWREVTARPPTPIVEDSSREEIRW